MSTEKKSRKKKKILTKNPIDVFETYEDYLEYRTICYLVEEDITRYGLAHVLTMLKIKIKNMNISIDKMQKIINKRKRKK